MEYSDLLVVFRTDGHGNRVKRYAICPARNACPGDLVTLHGDSAIYEVCHTFADFDGCITDAVTAANPVFYVREHWHKGKEFPLECKAEGDSPCAE